MKQRGKIYFIISTVIIVLLAFILMNGLKVGDYQINSLKNSLKLGLDLQGGVYVEETILDKNVTKDTIERTKDLIGIRVNGLGVSEGTVAVTNGNRIRVEMPGIFDAQKALDAIGKTGKLTFVGPDKSIILTGNDVKDATVGINSQTSQPEVQLKLTTAGAQKFAVATQKFLGKQIAIYMDNVQESNPTVEAVIPNGEAVITNGGGSIDDSKRLAGIIKSGALPVSLAPATVKTIGATLGAEAKPTSAKAAIIGIALVMLFMLLYYRIPGLIADLGLATYIMIFTLIFIFAIKATLTLPGIAGILLSVGIAVDANVLMFERLREELKLGKSLKSALDLAYHRALPSILDSNITTIISGLILYNFGIGAVKGFALTLVIGVLCSLFTALVITRFLLHAFVNAGWITDTKYYRPFTRS